MKSRSQKVALAKLREFAREIASDLTAFSQPPFCLYLGGQLGAGKTTFTQQFLYELGLDQRQTVKSPTFSYVCEYNIRGKWYAHLDLYRLESDADISDLVYARTYDGYIIEWPEKGNCTQILPATHQLRIEVVSESERNFNYVISE